MDLTLKSELDLNSRLDYTSNMNYLLTFLAFGLCFALMAIGVIIAKKVLKKGCSIDPESCDCLREGKDPASCDK